MVPLPTKPPEDDSAVPKQYAEEMVTRRSDVLKVTYITMPDYSIKRKKQAERMQSTGDGAEDVNTDAAA